MLNLLQSHLGGSVSTNKKYVTLLISSKTDISFIFSLIEKYPLLTSRKICQYNFALDCVSGKIDPKYFIQLRNDKYVNQKNLIFNLSQLPPYLPSYFPSWLSGFIEAEGCFSLLYLRTGGIKKQQFHIGQNNDFYILNMIKYFFSSPHTIYKDHNKPHFRISIGGLNSKLSI
jgi:hypothetical protein